MMMMMMTMMMMVGKENVIIRERAVSPGRAAPTEAPLTTMMTGTSTTLLSRNEWSTHMYHPRLFRGDPHDEGKPSA